MEKISIYVNDKLPIIIAYLIIFSEIVGQMLLKKFFNKEKGFLHTKVKTASDGLEKAIKELAAAKAELDTYKSEWEKEKAELNEHITQQAKKILKIERALKHYAKTGETLKEEIKPNT